jgi:hypothetical protein
MTRAFIRHGRQGSLTYPRVERPTTSDTTGRAFDAIDGDEVVGDCFGGYGVGRLGSHQWIASH